MNPFKGAGAVLFVALVIILLTGVRDTSLLLLGLSSVVVALCTFSVLASARRRRRDHRAARGPSRRAQRARR